VRRKWLFYVSLFIGCVFATDAQQVASADVQPAASAKRIGAIHIEQGEPYDALAEISQKANVAIGVEAILSKRRGPAIVIDFPGGTVADLLNMFVIQAPSYRWADTPTGIIHVSIDDGHIPLLDVVMSYPGAENKTRQQIWQDIASRPEISAWMGSAHCVRGELFHGGEFRDHNGPFSIVAGSLTLEQLLDDVALKSGDNYWVVVQSSRPQVSCQISIMQW
jgi:hypothetical protein